MWKEQTFEGSNSNLFFFGPKLVSWTAWGALTPILALPGPFKGVFGPRVGFGAPGEPNFPNNQMGPIFVIPLFFLHLNSWKRYSFEISSPKIAQNSQKWQKLGIHKWPFFEKTSPQKWMKMAWNIRLGPLYTLILVWARIFMKKISWQQNWNFWPLLVAYWDKTSWRPLQTRRLNFQMDSLQ